MSLDLKAIRERVDAATPGPWSFDERGGHVSCADGWIAPTVMYDPDCAFIAHAREDVPALLDEIERLTRSLRHAEQLLKIYPDLKGNCSTGRHRCKGHAG